MGQSLDGREKSIGSRIFQIIVNLFLYFSYIYYAPRTDIVDTRERLVRYLLSLVQSLTTHTDAEGWHYDFKSRFYMVYLEDTGFALRNKPYLVVHAVSLGVIREILPWTVAV